MPKLHLTNSIITKSQCPEGRKKLDLFDTKTKGLMLEIRATGGRTFYLRYTDRYGKTRQHRIADGRDITLAQARSMADRGRNKIALGTDPSDEKAEMRSIPTFREFAYEQYLPFARTYKLSWKCDEGLIRNHLLPRFGERHLDEIHPSDIRRLVQSRLNEDAAPGSVNRLIIIMRYMYNLYIRDWKLPGVKANPTSGMRMLNENNMYERYLTNDEVARLHAAVVKSSNKSLRYIVAFLLLTGARRAEVLNARWSDVDLVQRLWKIPLSKGGKTRYVPLSDGAMKVLTQAHEATAHLPTDAIFPNFRTQRPYNTVFWSWDKARREAGLADVRMHDLRHSFASILINQGRSLYEVQLLLGHTQLRTTQRYAHMERDTLLEASNATSHVSNIFDRDAEAGPNTPAERRSIHISNGHAYRGPQMVQKGMERGPWKNLLEGMQTEEHRLADEQAFFDYFDFLESQQPRRAQVGRG